MTLTICYDWQNGLDVVSDYILMITLRHAQNPGVQVLPVVGHCELSAEPQPRAADPPTQSHYSDTRQLVESPLPHTLCMLLSCACCRLPVWPWVLAMPV